MRQKTRRDVRLRETEILGHLERTYRSRIAQLEQQVASLQEQGKVQRRLHEQELRQKQADADKMREVVSGQGGRAAAAARDRPPWSSHARALPISSRSCTGS